MPTCTFKRDDLHFRFTAHIESAQLCPRPLGQEHRPYEVPYRLKLAVYESDPEQTGNWRALYVGKSRRRTFREDSDDDELAQQLTAERDMLVTEALAQVECLRPIRKSEARAQRRLADVLSKAGV